MRYVALLIITSLGGYISSAQDKILPIGFKYGKPEGFADSVYEIKIQELKQSPFKYYFMSSIVLFRSLLASLSLFGCSYANAQIKYPVARKEGFDTMVYGRKLSDDYFWMSRKYNEKEATEFSRQQGKLAQSI